MIVTDENKKPGLKLGDGVGVGHRRTKARLDALGKQATGGGRRFRLEKHRQRRNLLA
jgi:hypothetical protein